MNADMLTFWCLYRAVFSRISRLDSPRTGVGTDMAPRSPSCSDEIFAGSGETAHDGMEPPRPESATDPDLPETVDCPRLEEVSLSPSPLLLQPLQFPEGEWIVSEVESTALPPSSSSIPLSEPVETNDADTQITTLPQPPIPESEPVINTSDAIQEHILAVSPQLASIPETVEEDGDGEVTTTTPPPPSTLGPTSESSALPTVDYSTIEAAAWTPLPEPTLPNPLAAAISSVESQSTDLSFPSLLYPADLQPDPEDIGDTSSPVSTNGESSSVFDEDYHSDISSYTASLLSDVKNYAYENGRRYHSYREGHYVLPNDEQEQDRQDLLHHVRNLVLNGALFRAPMGENVERVLDIGTGTGIWAIDFADSYPSAEVVGTDLSPIQPSWVPPNLRFMVDDAEEPWLFSASRPFDFIHARDLGGAIADWPRLLGQAYQHLRPGGWVELQEFEVTLKSDDDSLRRAPTLCEFLGRLHEASEAFNRPMNIAEGHRQRLIDANFEEVRDEVYKVPSSGWLGDPVQKQIGRYNLCSLLMAVESYSLALFTRVLGWSNNDTQVFLAGVRRDLKNPDVHTYCNLHIVYGRKPLYDYRA